MIARAYLFIEKEIDKLVDRQIDNFSESKIILMISNLNLKFTPKKEPKEDGYGAKYKHIFIFFKCTQILKKSKVKTQVIIFYFLMSI